MRHLDLFSGIGGFALAVEAVWPDAEHVFCDNDPFCEAILKKHWPNAKIYGDIRELATGLEAGTIGLWNGNAPNAESDQSPKADHIASHAIQKESPNGVKKTERIIGRHSAIGIEKEKMKSLNATEDDALVVEKKKKSFYQSTTSTKTGTSNGANTSRKHGNSSSGVGIRPTIKSSATTAITQNPTEYAHTASVDILTGGFPCQPFSHAGKRLGEADDRFLWREMLRVIRTVRPSWIVGENVAGIISLALEQVCLDLEAENYEVQPFVIPACAVNAPHRRDRVWIVARNTEHDGQHGAEDTESGLERANRDPQGAEQVRQPQRTNRVRNVAQTWEADWAEVAGALCRVDDGLRRRVDRAWRLKALGNAIVPQVAIEVLKAIKASS